MRIKNRFVRQTICNLPGFHGSLFTNNVRFDGTSAAAGITAMTLMGIADSAVRDGLQWVQRHLKERREERNALRREDERRRKPPGSETAVG